MGNWETKCRTSQLVVIGAILSTIMGGCAAVNCTNHSRKGFRMFRFPKNEERRKKWIINCRRDEWEPGPQAQLCIVHFEESQFENHRQDQKKKLKLNAVPTLFNVPNKPPLVTNKRQKGVGRPKPGSLLEKIQMEQKENTELSSNELVGKVEMLEKQIETLKTALQEKDEKLSSFLSQEQIAVLTRGNQSVAHWSNDSIIKGLKIRFALGKHGYNYLKSTGYPTPAYSTLNRRIQHIKFDFGVMNILFPLLKAKVETLDVYDRNCCLLVDEMEIANVQDFDTSQKCFVGNVTLGEPGVANHYLVVMLRGLKSPWKQVVAHELTGRSTSGPAMKKLISSVIDAASEIGINVKAVTSDMGSNNKAMWVSLGVYVNRNERKTSFTSGNGTEQVHSLADVPHLLKNLRNAFLSRIIHMPTKTCKEQDLPTNQVSSGYVKQLWISEITSESSLRSLHHLSKRHLFPTHFSSMNVAAAVQLFSIKTAAALEKAVSLRQINKLSLSTAWFIRIVNEWFVIMTARHRKVGITQRNMAQKIRFLEYFINVIQETEFGKGWKPVQTGIIMSTLSVINITKEFFSEGLTFFLPGRLTQDALENVFSQVRKKSGSKPTALEAKTALRLISISQFISDVKNSNYASDSDFHLFDHTLNASFLSGVRKLSENSQSLNSKGDESLLAPSSSQTSFLPPAVEENDIYYIAGATLNAILKNKSICEHCHQSVKEAIDLEETLVPKYRTLLTEYNNFGGLQKPKSGLYRICRESERAFKKSKPQLLASQLCIDDNFIDTIKSNCQNVQLPTCCKLEEKIIRYYLVTRCKGLKNHIINKKAHEASFGSASVNKKIRLE